MRHFIDIVEQAGSLAIPDARSAVTDELINRILSTKTFVSHTTDNSLWRWTMDMAHEGAMPSRFLVGGEGNIPLEVDDLVKDGDFRTFFHDWMLNKRAPWVNKCLAEELEDCRWLARGMYVKPAWLDSLALPDKGMSPLGIYWTTGEPFSPMASPAVKQANPQRIDVFVPLSGVMIDWQQTFESRFDSVHGDDECEIQLMKGSRIEGVEISTAGKESHRVEIHPSRIFIA